MSTYRYYPRHDELMHYGVMGMRWGVRRYQNADGTRTALGKRRERKGGALDEDAKKRSKARKRAAVVGGVAGGLVGAASIIGQAGVNSNGGFRESARKAAPWFDQNIKDGKDKPQISPAEKIIKETSKATEGVGRIANRVQQKKDAKRRAEEKARKKKEMAKLSDEELRRRINRLNLEKQYSDLTRDDTDLGRVTFRDVLDTTADVASIVGPAVTAIATIWMTKKKLGI